MKYHRTYLANVDTVLFCSAPLVVQAALSWLWVACARAENGGLLANSKGWTAKQWGAITNGQLARKHVDLVVDWKLASWEGDHLRVHFYDLAGQEAYQKDRERFTAHRERTRSAPGAHPETPPVLGAPLERIGSDQIESDSTGGEPGARTAPASPAGPAAAARTRISKPIAAIRAAVAAGDFLAVLRANGCRVDGMEAEWMAAGESFAVATLATVLLWADGLRQPITFPSQLIKARGTWWEMSANRRREIALQHAETLGTTALLQEHP